MRTSGGSFGAGMKNGKNKKSKDFYKGCKGWWADRDSNSEPLACKASALAD